VQGALLGKDFSMNRFGIFSSVLACMTAFFLHVTAFQVCAAGGTISGTVHVWKAKAKTEGPKNDKTVVVFLEGAVQSPPLTDKTISMDQRGLVFLPHIMAIEKGTSVKFLNNDPEKHNVYFLYDKTGETLDLGTWNKGQSVTHTFNDIGNVIVLCKLHLEMAAHIMVLDNPYFTEAVIDAKTRKASFVLDNIPPGKYILKAWNKKLKMKGKQVEVTVEDGKRTNLDIVITKRKYAK